MSEKLYLSVKKRLIDKKLTQSDLADACGISPVYLSEILRGKKDGKKPQEHIEKIKKILEIK